MGTFKLTSVEEMEAAKNRLLETGQKVGADAWQYRVKNQTPHCKFGEHGICKMRFGQNLVIQLYSNATSRILVRFQIFSNRHWMWKFYILSVHSDHSALLS